MKKTLTFLVAILFITSVGLLHSCGERSSDKEDETAGTESLGEDRASPMRKAEGKIGDKSVSVQYGSPSVKDRVIWGELEPYNEVWRTGANEATFVEFDKDVLVEGQPLAAGRYSLFTIPREKGPWTVIFNSEWDLEHGHYQYKEANDVLRVEVDPSWQEDSQEQLSISVEEDGLLVKWEKLELPIEIQ